MYDFQVFYIIKLCDECIIWIIIRTFGKLRKTDQSWREERRQGGQEGGTKQGREREWEQVKEKYTIK